MRCFTCVANKSHRCRNTHLHMFNCPDGLSYQLYTGSKVRQCIKATCHHFEDGYVHCPIIDSHGCEWCFKKLELGDSDPYDPSQNYDCYPKSYRSEVV